MSGSKFSAYFTGAAAKRLSEVEVDPTKSNQHEFQVTSAARAFLGETRDRVTLDARFVYLEDAADPFSVVSHITYYDARAAQTHRSSEYRLYYPDNEVVRSARPGDLLLIAQKPNGSLVVVIAAAGSTIESQVEWLFDFGALPLHGFAVAESEVFRTHLAPVDAGVLLDAFGIEPDVTTEDISEATIARFGLNMPSTAAFSEFARSLVPSLDPVHAPDTTLMGWWDAEYRAFQSLERHIVSVRLETGFTGDRAVEDFLSSSLSVQNRRKSRSGHAFENHLAKVFAANGLRFTPQGKTERNAKPDFLFPGQTEYDDPHFPADDLFMLAAKTTAKDRWRQLLSEADRVPKKHLITLEPAISSRQTDEMQSLGVQLVVPEPLHVTYTDRQQDWLWTVADFISETIEPQRVSPPDVR